MNGRKWRAQRSKHSSRSYHAYFARNNERVNGVKKELDPFPRVILVPGVGLFGLGASAKDAAIAADIAENTVDVITDAEAHESAIARSPEDDQFDVEYWSLEQAKLGKARGEAARAPGGRHHRRRLGHRRGDREGDGARGCGSRRARPRPRSGAARSPSRSAAMRCGSRAT